MTEPTIDEMLAWVDEAAVAAGPRDDKYRNAVRGILEQHRDNPPVNREMVDMIAYNSMHHAQALASKKYIALKAIRAFVERVGVRYASDKLWGTGEIETYLRLMREELAALESEVKE